MDRVSQEMSFRFQQLHSLAEEYNFLTPVNNLDKNFHDRQWLHFEYDIDKEQLLTQRRRLKYFVSIVAVDNSQCELWKQGLFDLLLFIQMLSSWRVKRQQCYIPQTFSLWLCVCVLLPVTQVIKS